jgi:hypothetical protein
MTVYSGRREANQDLYAALDGDADLRYSPPRANKMKMG